MKWKSPEFLKGVQSPIEGERAFRSEYPQKIIIGVDEEDYEKAIRSIYEELKDGIK